MIKLTLTKKPEQLTNELVAELTKEFKKTGKPVWKRKFIEDAVYELSNGKCCFTEIKLNEESKYLEIEHFHPKEKYKDEVLLWGNLLPSCKKVNGTKGEWDTKKFPIINPLIDNPKDHLYFKVGRFYDKTELGRTTIDHTGINDREHFANKRAKIALEVMEKLENLCFDFEDLNKTDFDKKSRRFKIRLRKYKNLLAEGGRKKEYAALCSTVMLTDLNNEKIETLLKEKKLWGDELEKLKKELKFCALI